MYRILVTALFFIFSGATAEAGVMSIIQARLKGLGGEGERVLTSQERATVSDLFRNRNGRDRVTGFFEHPYSPIINEDLDFAVKGTLSGKKLSVESIRINPDGGVVAQSWQLPVSNIDDYSIVAKDFAGVSATVNTPGGREVISYRYRSERVSIKGMATELKNEIPSENMRVQMGLEIQLKVDQGRYGVEIKNENNRLTFLVKDSVGTSLEHEVRPITFNTFGDPEKIRIVNFDRLIGTNQLNVVVLKNEGTPGAHFFEYRYNLDFNASKKKLNVQADTQISSRVMSVDEVAKLKLKAEYKSIEARTESAGTSGGMISPDPDGVPTVASEPPAPGVVYKLSPPGSTRQVPLTRTGSIR